MKKICYVFKGFPPLPGTVWIVHQENRICQPNDNPVKWETVISQNSYTEGGEILKGPTLFFF